jgi:antitoxin component YwqK of YwqJK toxin-antitoxin module
MTGRAEQLIFPLLAPECQSNLVITVDMNHPKPCPLEYTNTLANTNLFSAAEQRLLREIAVKYKNVTTNSGPPGTIFKMWGMRQRKFQQYSKIIPVACFVYTNSADREEIASLFGDQRYILGKYRTPTGDGYDVIVVHDALLQYQGYKNGVLDGLCVQIYGEGNENRCVTWTRFSKGKAIGKFIMWGDDGKIVAEVEFKEPFDFLKFQTAKFDLSWTEVQANMTNFTPNPK